MEKLYFLTQTPTRGDRYLRKTQETERKTRPQYQKVSVSARKDAHTYPETCMPTAID